MSRRRFTLYWLPVISWAVLILIGTSPPRVPGPDLSGHDKNVHLVIYLVLGLLLVRAFIGARRLSVWSAAGWTVLTGGIFGALQELNQTYIPGRSGTVDDFLANLAGLVLATAMVGMWYGLRHKRDTDHREQDGQGDGSDGGSAAH